MVPSEYSSGNSVHRGRLTKAGNAHLRRQLVEAAWAYQHRPSVGVALARRQHGLDPAVVARAWAAQQRLAGRFRALAARKNTKRIVAAAIARELLLLQAHLVGAGLVIHGTTVGPRPAGRVGELPELDP